MSTSTSELSAHVAVSSSAVVAVGVLTAVNTHSDPSPSGVASMNATPTAATLSTQPTLGPQFASPPPTLRLRPPNAPLRPTHHHRNPANRNLFGFWANDQQHLGLEDQEDKDEVGADSPRSPRSSRSPRSPRSSRSPRSPRSPRSTRDRSASPVRPLGAARSLSPLRSESPSY